MKSVTPHRRIKLLPLIGIFYFMVSGGPFGLEELIQKNGCSTAILILLVTPIVWSVPTALMVGELGAALPHDGGYYAWTRRAMGPFFAFQEAWLSLAASVFDMAIYPTLFVLYLGRLWPGALASPTPVLLGVAVIGAGAIFNMRGSKAVGEGSSLMTVCLLMPFVLLAALLVFGKGSPALVPPPPKLEANDFAGSVVIAMWNYMGWDNASTVAGEVSRPQRTYPIAVIGAVLLVATTYVVPVVALRHAGVDTSNWTTGSWVDAAGQFGGPILATAVVVGGMVSSFGMFNALCLSYSRLPVVLAEDGFLPPVFARRLGKNDAPWVAILTCSVIWTASLGLSFERLVSIDILLYGLSLILEFAALIILRVREPSLPRPFKIPGGVPVLVVLALGPIAVLTLALFHNLGEKIAGMNAITFALVVVSCGPVLYYAMRPQKTWAPSRLGDVRASSAHIAAQLAASVSRLQVAASASHLQVAD